MLGSSVKSVSAVGVEESVSTKGSAGSGSGGSAPGAGVVVVDEVGACLGGHGGTLVLRSDLARSDLERSDSDDGALAGGGIPPGLGSLDEPGLPFCGLSLEDRDRELSEAG